MRPKPSTVLPPVALLIPALCILGMALAERIEDTHRARAEAAHAANRPVQRYTRVLLHQIDRWKAQCDANGGRVVLTAREIDAFRTNARSVDEIVGTMDPAAYRYEAESDVRDENRLKRLGVRFVLP